MFRFIVETRKALMIRFCEKCEEYFEEPVCPFCRNAYLMKKKKLLEASRSEEEKISKKKKFKPAAKRKSDLIF
jgi:recombinational DNA repair protein RecR